MKKLFYFGSIGLLLFEIANVYFIMPLPGSQRMNSIGLAYFLYQWRWMFRIVFAAMIGLGIVPTFRDTRWKVVPAIVLLAAGAVAYLFNWVMTADKMFYPPQILRFADAEHNKVKPEKLVLGIEIDGQARAYPIQYMGYHHQVRDTVGQHPVMVTYCTVCRTGRVFKPEVEGKIETFRLVGMDHFNAMFEDHSTHSWWRQENGEAIAGPLSGAQLPELPCTQGSLSAWLALYPNSLIMQPDSAFYQEYDSLDTYDVGRRRGKLTGTDTLAWQDKSWVIGIDVKRMAKAYDWNQLKKERLISDEIGGEPVLVALHSDNKSFYAFERPLKTMVFTLQNDSLVSEGKAWDLRGRALTPGVENLKKIRAYQEFWHSWRTFHPETQH